MGNTAAGAGRGQRAAAAQAGGQAVMARASLTLCEGRVTPAGALLEWGDAPARRGGATH
jgi:hypothetical protein